MPLAHILQRAMVSGVMLALFGCGGGQPGAANQPTPVSSVQATATAALPSVLTYLQSPREGLLAQTEAGQAYTVSLNSNAFNALQVGDQFTLTVPGAGSQVVTITRREELLGRIVVLTGSVAGWSYSVVRLSASDGAVSGSVVLDSQEWRIESRAGVTTLQNLGAAGIREMPSHPPSQNNEVPIEQKGPAAVEKPARLRPAAAGNVSKLEVLFASDESYQKLMGGEANELADIGNILSYANAAFADSGAFVSLNLAGYTRLTADLTTLSNNEIYDQLKTNKGAFSTMRAQKLAASADITVAVSRFNDAKVRVCGLGALGMFFTSGAFSNSTPATAVISRGVRPSDGATCAPESLAHEVGHVLGAMHDRANSPNAGAYPYSYGFGVSGRFGDIMSYIYPRVPYFSSPVLNKCAGSACGTATEDSVRTFNNTAPLVAASADSGQRLSGWYWDPTAQGTGWAVEVVGDKAFVAAFVYAENGLPTWVVGTAAICAGRTSTFCVGLDEYVAGQTLVGTPKTPRTNRRVADAELTFSSGYPATLQIRLGTVTRQLQRFVFSTGGLDAAPTFPGTALPGWYWNVNAQGTGIFVERQNDTIFAAYFYYRADGTPTWSVVTGRNWLPNTTNQGGFSGNLLPFVGYRNGQTLTGPFRAASVFSAQEASTFLHVDTGFFTVYNASGTRSGEVWSKFSF